jgi:hypothetical protein
MELLPVDDEGVLLVDVQLEAVLLCMNAIRGSGGDLAELVDRYRV